MDIVDELRERALIGPTLSTESICTRAADEIERLRLLLKSAPPSSSDPSSGLGGQNP